MADVPEPPAASEGMAHRHNALESRSWPDDVIELMPIALPVGGTHAEGEATAETPRVPEWAHICPAGELDEEGRRVVRGRDGRTFEIPADPQSVIDGTELPAQLDWDHESLMWFGSTKAAGWIDELVFVEADDAEGRKPGFWAHVEEWTPEGRDDVEHRRFRGLSPAVRYQHREPAIEGDAPPPPLLIGFVNVALTNRPNLRMTLLNRSGGAEHNEAPAAPEVHEMDEELKKLARRLGLHENATVAEIARAAAHQLDTLVPKGDLELALNRANAAEGELTRIRDERHAADVTATIEAARKAGKINPASVEHYRAMCATPEGLKGMKDLFATLPSIVGDDDRHTGTPPEVGDPKKAPLTASEQEMARHMGLTDEEFMAAR